MNYTGNDFYCDVAIPRTVPLNIVYEDEHVLAFHHTKPHWPVHIVVVPKVHVLSLGEFKLKTKPWIIIDFILRVERIAEDVEKMHGAARIITNRGRYRDSNHLHFHVVSGDEKQ